MAELKHILCIDDDRDILEIAQIALENVGGYQVSTSNNAISGIEKAQKDQPDLIVMDMMMPHMNGMQALAKLKADETTAQIPVVFMTARVRGDEVDEYMEKGASGVISKPFDPIELAKKLNDIWRREQERG